MATSTVLTIPLREQSFFKTLFKTKDFFLNFRVDGKQFKNGSVLSENDDVTKITWFFSHRVIVVL